MTLKCQPKASHFINGEYIEDNKGDVIECTFPATGEVIARVHSATPEIINLALKSAQNAQKKWAKIPAVERGRILRRASDIMRRRNHELSVLETYDTGKPMSETLYVDATSGADAFEYFGGLAAAITGEHIPLNQDMWAYTKRIPLGVCVGIGAWNYPTQIACWKGAPALACGNTMVFKPSETTPLCALEIANILIQAGAPAGVYNVIQGYGDVGGALVRDERVAKISLTGSVKTGKQVYAAAAANMKHVTMELGGKSPLIIFDDADLENAVSGAMLANMYSTGQVCSNGTRVFVQKGIKDKFLNRFVERISTIKIGNPLDETTQFGPMVSKQQRDIVMNFITKGIKEGARLVYGGTIIEGDGYFIEPTVFSDVADTMTIARQEIFGPVMSVFDFETEEEVIKRANDTEFGLAGGVFTQNIQRAHRVIDAIDAGTCYINTYNDASVEAPFGGLKASGVGRENSKEAINHYSQTKTVYIRMSDVESPY